MKYVDPNGLLTQDTDNWDQVFDDDDDSFLDAVSEAGYESWEDALPNVTDDEGNYIDISNYLDESGDWRGTSLIGVRLKHNPARMVEWTANETLRMTGFAIVLDSSGMTFKHGSASVTFSNGSESFDYEFDVTSGESYGIFSSVGYSVTKTKYTKLFPDNIKKEDIINSYYGYFVTFSGSLGIESLGDIGKWMAKAEGGSVISKLNGEFGYTIGYTSVYGGNDYIPLNPWQGPTNGGGIGLTLFNYGIPFSGGESHTYYYDEDKEETYLYYWGMSPEESQARREYDDK